MASDRTEQATARRRQQARERGQVLRSRDLVGALTLLAVIFLLAWQPQEWIARWQQYFRDVLVNSIRSDWTESIPVASQTMFTVAKWIGPVMTVAFFVALFSTVAQG